MQINPTKLLIAQVLLLLAGAIAGAAICCLVQNLNAHMYELSASAHFQESFAQITFFLLVLGVAIFAGSCALLVLSLNAGGNKNSALIQESLANILQLCGVEGAANPVEAIQTTVGQLKLDLAEAKKRERAIVEKAVDVICILDTDAKFLSVSRACQHAWGFKPSEIEARPMSVLLVGDNSTNILNSILGSANSIDKIIFECQLKRKDDRIIDVVWTAHWSASDGGLFCIVHDISERKNAERILAESEKRLRSMLEEMPVGVLLVDGHGKIEFANAEASRMVSKDITDLVGSLLVNHLSPEEKTRPEQNVLTDQQSTDHQAKRSMALALREDGSTLPVDLSQSVIELGSERRTIVVFLDKTAEKELERVKREFVAMVTHEIRTPISSVYGILALLEAGALGEMTAKGVELAGSVKVTCKRVITLISDLLDLEKVQSGKFAIEPKQVSVRFAMECSLDNVRSLADERNIEIELPQSELCCWADEDRLVQVMVNLIANSIKYSPAGSKITLGVEEPGGGFLRITVRDQGRGIPEEKLSKVFEQFEQVELADGRKKAGTGLGLAICQAIVSQHGGEIGVTSTVGVGSCFWFTIPVNQPVEPA